MAFLMEDVYPGLGQEASCWRTPHGCVSCRILSQTVVKTWGQWNYLGRGYRTGSVPLAASMLGDGLWEQVFCGSLMGAAGRREENWGLVPSPFLRRRWLQAALVGEAGAPCLTLAWSSCHDLRV